MKDSVSVRTAKPRNGLDGVVVDKLIVNDPCVITTGQYCERNLEQLFQLGLASKLASKLAQNHY
jgi:hypothetical protein